MPQNEKMDIALKYIYDNGKRLQKSRGMWKPVYKKISSELGTKLDKSGEGRVRVSINTTAVGKGLILKEKSSGDWVLTQKGLHYVQNPESRERTKTRKNKTKTAGLKQQQTEKQESNIYISEYKTTKAENVSMFLLGFNVFALIVLLLKFSL
jgi:hypothetical protein